ncbi:MAG: efflux RND transporter periplasmic adaptor subunit [Proteobacteria bacterium]|nr:efflux RND transporter periplasmic adaptor subunit [Pseudomonadota bacterium]
MKSAILIALAAAVIVAFSCSNERGGFLSKLLKGGSAGVPVTVETVAFEDRAALIELPAAISASERVDVSLPEDAVIESFAVAEGEAVGQGDVIARISEEEIAVRLARLRADQREMRNKLEKDSYVLRNRDRLLDEGRIDEEMYDAVEKEVADDEAEIERIQGDISRLEANIGELAVLSPIAGVLTKRYVAAGSIAMAGSPVATVQRIDPAIVEFKIGQEMSAEVKPEMRVDVVFQALGGRREQGRVMSVDTKVDPKDNRLLVRASLPNPGGTYKEGMAAGVEIRSARTRRIYLIPEGALIREPRGYFVFTVEKGLARKVQVIPEQTRGGRIEIGRGLKDDDMVVVAGQDRIAEGTAVDIWGR